MVKTRRRWALTLIEMLIVITLISIIGAALTYNMGPALAKGRQLTDEMHKRKIREILMAQIAQGHCDPREIESDWKECIRRSGWIEQGKKGEELFRDPYGKEYEVTYDSERHEVVVHSSSS